MSERTFTAVSYDQFLSENKLMASKCKKCGALWLPPRPLCVKCYGTEMEWVELKGKGKLVAFTVIPYGPMPMSAAGYGKDNPYCAAIVELEEGIRVSAQVKGLDVTHPENIKIGTPLTVDFSEKRGKWFWGGETAKITKTYLAFKAL